MLTLRLLLLQQGFGGAADGGTRTEAARCDRDRDNCRGCAAAAAAGAAVYGGNCKKKEREIEKE